MRERRFALVPYPWRAAIDTTTSGPAIFFSTMIEQTLNYRLPASRRFGWILSSFGRRGLPPGLIRRGLRLAPKRQRPDIDALLDQLSGSWEDLRKADPGLPEPGHLSTLALERSAGLTLFVFVGDGGRPAIVAKIPRSSPGVDVEVDTLNRVVSLQLAPRFLGRVGDLRVQGAVIGSPLRVEPVGPDQADEVAWGQEHQEIAMALERLAAGTLERRNPEELAGVAAAMTTAGLSKSCEKGAVCSVGKVEKSQVSVLRHGDVAPQNCLLENGRFVALVDWELARATGVPGFDQLNAAISYLELGIGLVRWNEDRVVAAFKNAWDGSDLFGRGRAAALACVRAAGGDADLYLDVEKAFFARRLARRAARPHAYPTGPTTAAAMLEFVCAH